MTVRRGILALLEGGPGKGDELGTFLESGGAIALAEEGTVTWYAFKISDTSYGIFDTFEPITLSKPTSVGRSPRLTIGSGLTHSPAIPTSAQ